MIIKRDMTKFPSFITKAFFLFLILAASPSIGSGKPTGSDQKSGTLDRCHFDL